MMKKAIVYKNIALTLAVVLLVLTGCGGGAPKPVDSILLITVDSLRADHVGCYGGSSASTPAIDGMAATGTRFVRSHANSVQTLPSHASILSGLYPSAHGVLDNSGFRFPGNVETAATLLKAQGFATAAFVGSSTLDSRYGLTPGFDVYDDNHGDVTRVQEFQLVERRAEGVTTPFLKWVDARQPGAKWFAWIHFNDPHAPYAPVEPYGSKFASRPYDGEIASVDAQVGRILGHLKQRGWSESTSVIVTSDHGEGLGDHGEPTHGIFAYESTLRVPLIVSGPGIAPKSVEAPVQHIDLLPTMIDLAGGTVPGNLKGMSLKPLLYGKAESEKEPRDLYFEAMTASQDRRGAPLTGILRGSYKYIEVPIPELYDIDKDPGEKQNLSDKQPDVVADLKTRLSAISEAAGAAAAAGGQSPEELERLQSLGYVAGGDEDAGQSVSYTADDDPKNIINLETMLEDGVAAARAGDLERARQLFSDIIAERPSMSIAYGHLAVVYRRMGQPKKGVEILEGALKDGHGIPGMLTKLGLCFIESGDTKRAIEVLEQAVRESDDNIDAQMYLAQAYEKAGQPDRARAAFQNILTDDPGNDAASAGMEKVAPLRAP
ncbi:MAG: sulfatase-like hydrolase/transferase [Acidobacteria bacterium]|nr:sulfatase-like hydrolase/transferase [Acidobacteriota bacterium]